MKYLTLFLLMGVLILPISSNSEPIPPEGPECPCDTIQLQSGSTGLEVLEEICPDGELSEDGILILTKDVLEVRLDDPRREFRTLFDTSNQPFFSCQVTEDPQTIGVFLTEGQFQSCRDTIIEQCGLEIRPIPTLSEWGLIALAGLIGFAGLIVISRKRILS